MSIGSISSTKDSPAGDSNEAEQITGTVDITRLRPVAFPQKVLFPFFHACGKEAERLCSVPSNARTEELQDVYDIRTRCSVCGDQINDRRNCPETVWTLKLFICKYCGSALLVENEKEYAVNGKVPVDGVSLSVGETLM